MKDNSVLIYDSTLRDGEQAPGFAMTPDQKLIFARELDRLGVDVIEAGFAAASSLDKKAVEMIAREIARPEISVLCRALPGDIDAAWDVLHQAARPRLHIFAPTSDIQLEDAVGKTRDEMLSMIRRAVQYAKSIHSRVHFSAMDGTRSDRSFLYEVFLAAYEEGAEVLNISDTVGYAVPGEIEDIVSSVKSLFPREEPVISIHCHDDLGHATVNSLAALKAGARQVEGTINGIGERAGNAPLEEIIMSIKTRPDIYPFETSVDSSKIIPASRLLSSLTGTEIPLNKPVVGANVFLHQSGIHQAGVLKNRKTFEVLSPEDLGYEESGIVLGRHSGRHALASRYEDLGVVLSEKELSDVYARFLGIAVPGEVNDADLLALVGRTEKYHKYAV